MTRNIIRHYQDMVKGIIKDKLLTLTFYNEKGKPIDITINNEGRIVDAPTADMIGKSIDDLDVKHMGNEDYI